MRKKIAALGQKWILLAFTLLSMSMEFATESEELQQPPSVSYVEERGPFEDQPSKDFYLQLDDALTKYREGNLGQSKKSLLKAKQLAYATPKEDTPSLLPIERRDQAEEDYAYLHDLLYPCYASEEGNGNGH
jgi:hypothetical protein